MGQCYDFIAPSPSADAVKALFEIYTISPSHEDGIMSDPILKLLDANGNLIARNDDCFVAACPSANFLDSFISADLTSGATYYVCVADWAGCCEGNDNPDPEYDLCGACDDITLNIVLRSFTVTPVKPGKGNPRG